MCALCYLVSVHCELYLPVLNPLTLQAHLVLEKFFFKLQRYIYEHKRNYFVLLKVPNYMTSS